MSTFAQLFERMMAAHNVTMHQIAARLEVEYHVLSRFKNGTKKRSVKLLKSILRVVPCNNRTEQELYEALFREELQTAYGEEAWECIKTLKELLSIQFLSVDEMSEGMENVQRENQGSNGNDIWIMKNSLISGRSSVRDAVLLILNQVREESDDLPIVLWGQGTDTLLSDIAFAFHNTEISVEHLYSLLPSTSQESNLNNLKLLAEVMPCLRSNFNYDVRVVYEEISSREAFFPFECLLMTEKVALWIEKEYNHAQIVTDSQVLAFYRAKFESQYKNSKTVLHRSINIVDWQNEAQEMEDEGDTFYCLNWQLCAMELIPVDVLVTHIKPEKKEYLISALGVYQKRVQTVKKKKKKSEYITREGIQYFIDTGKILELPDEWYIPFSKEERCAVLHRLLELIQKEYETEQAEKKKDAMSVSEGTKLPMIQILNTNYFSLTPGIAVRSSGEADTDLSCLGYDGNMINFSFYEAGITRWIFCLLEFLPESGWVYSLKEQVRLLEEMLEKMDSQSSDGIM